MFVKLTGITFSTKKVASAPTRIDVAVAGDALPISPDALLSPLHSNSETTPSDAALPPKNQALDSLVLSSTSQPDALPKSDKSPVVPTG